MIRIQIARSGFDARFGTILGQAKNPTAILMGVGREAGNLLKRHFRQKDQSEVNKLAPGRREHFWLQVSRSVSAPVQTGYNAISVSVNDPRIAQKVFGGPIVAKRVRNLAIPQTEKAYGRTPATFERETGLKLFVLASKGRVSLAAKMAGGAIEIEYVLKHQVNQKADPTALPEEKEFEEALLKRGQAMLDRQTEANK